MSMYNTTDFDEMVLAHMLRCPEVYNRAKKLRITGEDFLSSTLAGIQLYKTIADISLRLNLCPIPKNILEMELNQLIEAGILMGDYDQLQQLVNWFYEADLSVAYVNHHLIDFIKHRRFSKINQETSDSVSLFSKLLEADREIPKAEGAVIVDPFAEPIMCASDTGISTGFLKVDASLGGGTHKRECGLIMAASGSGKTAIGINFSIGGMRNHNTLYVSLEEPADHLIQRYYANLFQLEYTKLKNGDPDTQRELRTTFSMMTDIEKSMYRRLKIVDGRNQCPINYKGIEELIERAAQESGFVADVVIIDQLDFMTPYKTMPKSADKWREYEQTTMEIDELSNYMVGGVNPIGVWVLHQIRGKPRWEYDYNDIAGYKGVVKPFDLAIGVGRAIGEPYVNIHSMKTRHGEPFAHSYRGDFAKMTFIDCEYKPPQEAATNGYNGPRKAKKEEGPLPPPTFNGTRIPVDEI